MIALLPEESMEILTAGLIVIAALVLVWAAWSIVERGRGR